MARKRPSDEHSSPSKRARIDEEIARFSEPTESDDELDSVMTVFDRTNDNEQQVAHTPSTSAETLPSLNHGEGWNLQQQDGQTYRISARRIRAFGEMAQEEWYIARFSDEWYGLNVAQILDQLHTLFSNIITQVQTQGVQPMDLVRIHISHPDIIQHGDVTVSIRPFQEITPDVIISALQNYLQSNDKLIFDQQFEIAVGAIRVPAGGGRTKITSTDGPNNSLFSKRSVVTIQNDDQLCMARALVVCRAYRQYKDDILTYDQYNYICQSNRSKQGKMAKELQQETGIPIDAPCTIKDLAAFEEVMDAQVIVFSSPHGNNIIYAGVQERDTRYFLYYTERQGREGHFDAVNSASGVLGVSYFCPHCFATYSCKNRHTCKNICFKCKVSNCSSLKETDDEEFIICDDCNVIFRSTKCYQNHLNTEGKNKRVVKSVCAVFWKCQNCQLTMKRSARSPQEHVCYEWRCGCCKEYTTDDLHKCYLQPLEPKKPGYKYIFFDLECVQESGQHEVNLAVAQLCCEDCIDSPDINSPCKCGVRCTQCYTWLQSKKAHKKPLCDGCGHRQIIVKDGENTLDKFCKWLFDKSHYGYTVIAHNMKAYDGQLLNQYIVRNGIRAKYIYSGSKIMYMHLQNGTNIRLVDSLNFFAQSLSSLPDAFGLDGVKKGHFPHFFNTWSNQDYVGPYPPPGMYGADQMTSKARKKFDEWYNGVTDQTFDFAKELVEYCVDDVNILRRACLTFRALMMGLTKETDGEDDEEEPDADDSDDEYDTEEAAYALEEELEAEERRKNQKKKHAGIDPFQHITLASLCTHVYRSKFYHTTDTEQDPPIGQIPAGGYARYRQCSKVAISWLEYVMHTEDIHIRHALNHPAGEYKVPGTKIIADGYCRATNTLFFFNGCVFHACDTCNTCVRHPVTGQKGWEIRKKDEDHMIQLAERGYKVRVIWEHEYRKRLRQDKEMKEFVDSLDIQERLDPRASFFGGRTGGYKLHHKVGEDGAKIRYSDIVSLYPSTQFFGKFPKFHPQVILSNFKDISHYYGLAFCKILPAKKLFFPVLPAKINNRLIFTLCRKCAEEERQGECTHTDEQRALTGVWCTPEINKAVQMGYTVMKIYEVYHYEESIQYDKTTGKKGLFHDYIMTFLKIKAEASGFPSWVKSDEDKQKFVQDFYDYHGIQLDINNIVNNPGLRTLAKVCLNTLWGRLALRGASVMSVTQFIYSAEALVRAMTDKSRVIKDFHIVRDDTILLQSSLHKDHEPASNMTNVILASFTTCQARLTLYDLMLKARERCLYTDTDSLIYIERPLDTPFEIGEFLGMLSNELKPGEYISEFVSAGPKNYGYSTVCENGEGELTHTGTVVKVKGFTLSTANSRVINFQSMKDCVQQYVEKGVQIVLPTHNPSHITRCKQTSVVKTTPQEKKYKVVFKKRKLLPDYTTLPFGY